jgi:hypothetical protein
MERKGEKKKESSRGRRERKNWGIEYVRGENGEEQRGRREEEGAEIGERYSRERREIGE